METLPQTQSKQTLTNIIPWENKRVDIPAGGGREAHIIVCSPGTRALHIAVDNDPPSNAFTLYTQSFFDIPGDMRSGEIRADVIGVPGSVGFTIEWPPPVVRLVFSSTGPAAMVCWYAVSKTHERKVF